MKHMKVIGIAGPSCSGKSTVAALVSQKLHAPHISLDHFYNRDVPHMFHNGIRTYERPELYDGAVLAQKIIELVKTGKTIVPDRVNNEMTTRTVHATDVLVIESFLLFRYPELVALCDNMFYIDITWEEIVRRRKARNRGDRAEATFYQIGKDETDGQVAPQKKIPAVVVLDGMQTPEELARTIVERARN